MAKKTWTVDFNDEDPSAERPSEDLEMSAPCAACDRETAHRKLVCAATEYHEDRPGYECDEYYFTIQCQGCKAISFAHLTDASEGRSLIVYPGRVVGRRLLSDSYLIPPRVQTIYRETHVALSNALPILAAIGIRAIVEAVCRERDAMAPNLKSKISELRTQGVITSSGERVLHGLRFLGNKAAHEVAAHSAQELSLPFDVVEHLLSDVYVIPRKTSRWTSDDA